MNHEHIMFVGVGLTLYVASISHIRHFTLKIEFIPLVHFVGKWDCKIECCPFR